MSVIFALESAFSTNLLTSDILFSTAVSTEFVAKPLIPGISLSISLILAL